MKGKVYSTPEFVAKLERDEQRARLNVELASSPAAKKAAEKKLRSIQKVRKLLTGMSGQRMERR